MLTIECLSCKYYDILDMTTIHVQDETHVCEQLTTMVE